MGASRHVGAAALLGISLWSSSGLADPSDVNAPAEAAVNVDAAAQPAEIDVCYRRSICTERSGAYWGIQGASLGVLALLALITNNALDPLPPAKRVVAPTTVGTADAVLALQVTLPMPVFVNTMAKREIFDASFTYAQAGSLALIVNHLARPSRLNSSATLSFATAVTSAYLLDQRRLPHQEPPDYDRQVSDVRLRGTFWGLQLGLATANSVLAVRGGRTTPGAAVFGALTGSAIGFAAQWSHCMATHHECLVPSFIDPPGHRPMIWLSNAALLGIGAFLPFVAPAGSDDPNLHYTFEPVAFGPGSLGLGVRGEL